MTTPQLVSDLQRDEGFSAVAYPDPISGGEPWTIGYGRAHGVKRGDICTQAQADQWLAEDIKNAESILDLHLPWWRDMDNVRQDALVNMAFNLGGRLFGFHNMLADCIANDFDGAADEMLSSVWARQVGDRAKRLAAMMRTGARRA